MEWLDDSEHPLDWNGPTSREFCGFPDEDLDRPIIDHLERIVRRYPNRVAVTDSETSFSFAELWNGVSGVAETIAAQSEPGDLIGIALPACSMFPIAMLASLAAGRAFVVGDALEEARPALILSGCAFHPRCAQRMGRCAKDAPRILRPEQSRRVACHLFDPNGEDR